MANIQQFIARAKAAGFSDEVIKQRLASLKDKSTYIKAKDMVKDKANTIYTNTKDEVSTSFADVKDKAVDAYTDIKDKSDEAISNARTTTNDVLADVKYKAQDITKDMQGTVTDVIDQATPYAKALQKGFAPEVILQKLRAKYGELTPELKQKLGIVEPHVRATATKDVEITDDPYNGKYGPNHKIHVLTEAEIKAEQAKVPVSVEAKSWPTLSINLSNPAVSKVQIPKTLKTEWTDEDYTKFQAYVESQNLGIVSSPEDIEKLKEFLPNKAVNMLAPIPEEEELGYGVGGPEDFALGHVLSPVIGKLLKLTMWAPARAKDVIASAISKVRHKDKAIQAEGKAALKEYLETLQLAKELKLDDRLVAETTNNVYSTSNLFELQHAINNSMPKMEAALAKKAEELIGSRDINVMAKSTQKQVLKISSKLKKIRNKAYAKLDKLTSKHQYDVRDMREQLQIYMRDDLGSPDNVIKYVVRELNTKAKNITTIEQRALDLLDKKKKQLFSLMAKRKAGANNLKSIHKTQAVIAVLEKSVPQTDFLTEKEFQHILRRMSKKINGNKSITMPSTDLDIRRELSLAHNFVSKHFVNMTAEHNPAFSKQLAQANKYAKDWFNLFGKSHQNITAKDIPELHDALFTNNFTDKVKNIMANEYKIAKVAKLLDKHTGNTKASEKLVNTWLEHKIGFRPDAKEANMLDYARIDTTRFAASLDRMLARPENLKLLHKHLGREKVLQLKALSNISSGLERLKTKIGDTGPLDQGWIHYVMFGPTTKQPVQSVFDITGLSHVGRFMRVMSSMAGYLRNEVTQHIPGAAHLGRVPGLGFMSSRLVKSKFRLNQLIKTIENEMVLIKKKKLAKKLTPTEIQARLDAKFIKAVDKFHLRGLIDTIEQDVAAQTRTGIHAFDKSAINWQSIIQGSTAEPLAKTVMTTGSDLYTKYTQGEE